MPFAPPLAAAMTVVLLAGCMPTLADLKNELDLHRSSFSEKVITDRALSQKFLACVARSRGDRTGPAGPVGTLIRRIKERLPRQDDSLLALQEMFSGLAEPSRRRLNLATLSSVATAIRQWNGRMDFDEEHLAQDASRFVRLLSAYNRAYFGDVRFTATQADSGTVSQGVLRHTSHGFVDRSGNSLLFPGLSADLSFPTARSFRDTAPAGASQRVSADLARIFLEAFFDAAFEVPAVRGATALQVDWTNQEHPYPEFDPARPDVSLEALAGITRDALRAEAAVTVEVGKLVRGGSLFGTQNETVAATLETVAGVTAKKIVEHEGFCYVQAVQSRAITPLPRG